MADLRLIGYRFSVYTRVVRMTLLEKSLQADHVEVDPFGDPVDPILGQHTPFGRVPVLSHGDFHLYETAAIVRYLDGLGSDPSLTPEDPRAVARMQQVIGIIDHYGYRALVRGVFSEAVFNPAFGTPGDPDRIAAAIADAAPVLTSLEGIAEEGFALGDGPVTQADLHLMPMLAYFDMAPQGHEMLGDCPALLARFRTISRRPSFARTDPRPFTA
ncbi:glutathione S-transferase family protein [Sulfitobacter sp. D35]|uniref:glutathione S-transferase family protein n=1 Tax=Sulfitobacter sp. D35 TaxID=3083252 RepID=UPI00296E3A63|nr:glutathione S-transferase family protein [Sulfitobacter sp. D35]MDW4500174.1 glutathione S-transferase family protein [Sulfitobacter sp. D35]